MNVDKMTIKFREAIQAADTLAHDNHNPVIEIGRAHV